MSFLINAMPQSIHQPLGLMNLPNASLDNLGFESYQQKTGRGTSHRSCS